ncbi:response regulator transcription factor [Lacrimispora sp.]|uniref:response regulator transcription factor n=1 Tax=Lacrimispora sp. TaxID=2719234 RepID=UPI00345F6ADD
MRILIVEDEKRLAETLADIITENKDTADVCHDGQKGLDHALSGIYDAVILDVMLPHINGFDIVRCMREQGNTTPVLMLTAKGELEDRIMGLNNGADYYLTKPFETPELLACLKAITRRGGDMKSEELTYGDIEVSLAASELICRGRSVRLGAKELELIRLLIANQGILLPKESIYLKIWGYEGEAEDSIVEVYLSFLRKKLDHIGSKVKISVVRRVGYRLEVRE